MRKILLSAVMIGLIGGGAGLAMAQDHDRGGGQPGQGRGGAPHGEARGSQQSEGRGEPRGGPVLSAPSEHHDASPPRAIRGNDRGEPAFNRPENGIGGAVRGPSRDNRSRPDFNRPDNRPNEAARGSGPRRDFSSARNFHQNFRAERRFHAPFYRRPPGWYSHRWRWGEFLPAAFWVRDYWILDFVAYDLPPPPFGAVWVRVGDDALLIDRFSGEIIEVDYGVFY